MKTTNTQNYMDHLLSSVPFGLGMLGLLVAAYTVLKFVPTFDYSGWVGFLSSVIFGVISIYYSVWLWKNSSSITKLVFGSFALSFICVLCDAVIYKLVYNVLHIPHSDMSNLLLSSYNIPYTGFLVFQCLGWSIILFTNKTEKGSRRLFLYVPVVIVALACLTLFFLIFDTGNLQQWQGETSLHNFYGLVQALLQIAGFAAVLLCLAITKNKGIFYLAVAYLIELVGDVILNFGIFSQGFGMGSFAETFWILGLLLRVYGLANLKKEISFNALAKDWIYKLDDLRSQNVLWAIANSVIGMYAVFVLIRFAFPVGFMEGRLLQVLVSAFILGLVLVVTLNNRNYSSIRECDK